MAPLGRSFLAVLGATLVLAGPARAATKLVAANGADSLTCGTTASPCRSISQAIANALPGDTIKVGPGSYGDLNGDNAIGGPGEESGGCGGGCLIEISKAVNVVSTDGAGATTIRGPAMAALNAIVALMANDSGFGKSGKGFTVSGGALQQVFGLGARVKIMGNRLLQLGSAAGLVLNSNDAIVRGNVVPCTNSGVNGIYVAGTNAQLIGNVASGCGTGINLLSTNSTITGNVVTDNVYGLIVDVTVGLYSPPLKFTKNSFIGNRSYGIALTTGDNPPAGTTIDLSAANIYGNGVNTANCGIGVTNGDATAPITINIDKSFWGAGAPGADPADANCVVSDAGGGVIFNPTNNLLKPKSIKAPSQR